MKKHRELIFCHEQDVFMHFMLKFPFVHDLETGGWLKHPLTNHDLCGVCDYAAPKFVIFFISFVIWHLLDSDIAKRNRELCLQYGLITPNKHDTATE